ncbi:MAG: class I SAM-dependent methyltransferase [Planctomycetota bacterium]|jgi:hypothetical protein
MGKQKRRRGKGKKKRKGHKRRESRFTAATADKHVLYQLSVQDSEAEVDFLCRTYEKIRGKPPRHLREDFCGTALVSAEWVRDPDRTAEGYDIDPEVVRWALERNLDPEDVATGRCRIFQRDVREPSHRTPDVRWAGNFSYRTFKSRPVLLDYFRNAREDLAEDGILVLDNHGGSEALVEQEERREIDEGFTYVWDQAEYWPGTGDYLCHIHFEFADGTRMKKAFVYDWRLWSMAELKDLLLEAGFTRVDAYWEGTDEDGVSGNGEFTEDLKGENCLSWIAYLVATKQQTNTEYD